MSDEERVADILARARMAEPGDTEPFGYWTSETDRELARRVIAAMGPQLTAEEAQRQLDAQATTIDQIDKMPDDMRAKYQQGLWWDGIAKLSLIAKA